MRELRFLRAIILSILLCTFIYATTATAQPVSMEEARMVAKNWIQVIIDKKGDWGGYKRPEIKGIREFTRKGKFVGYFCSVSPIGYIIVSPRREMAPVKAYSARCNLDSDSEEGMVDLFKGRMERILDKVREIANRRKVITGQEIADTLEINYRPAWDAILNNPNLFMKDSEEEDKILDDMSFDVEGNGSGEVTSNYQEGNILLSSHWHQCSPYNNRCPDRDCATCKGRALVGCIATAAAQIMYHWCWPPWGNGDPYDDYYDWDNMRDVVTTESPDVEQAAVAELCREIGIAVDMDYGCREDGGSGAFLSDMEGAYKDHFRYPYVDKVKRGDYTATTWFNLMKDEFNANRPVQYVVDHHSIVGDGWQEIGALRQYHMNYGWGGDKDGWYTLDALYYPDPGEVDDEEMLIDIKPNQSLGSFLVYSTYAPTHILYRYFDVDCAGLGSTFLSGQILQFLPGVKVYCLTDSDDYYIRFEGGIGGGSATSLITRGEKDWNNGIAINIKHGAIVLRRGGSIRLF